MALKLLRGALAGSVFVLTALLTSAALWLWEPALVDRDPINADARLAETLPAGFLEAELFLRPGLVWQLDIHVTTDVEAIGPIRPTVIFEMAEMNMGQSEPPLHFVAAGEFHAEGRFPMPGLWRVRLGLQDQQFDLVVSVPQEDED